MDVHNPATVRMALRQVFYTICILGRLYDLSLVDSSETSSKAATETEERPESTAALAFFIRKRFDECLILGYKTHQAWMPKTRPKRLF